MFYLINKMDKKDLEGVVDVLTVLGDDEVGGLLEKGWKLLDFEFKVIRRFNGMYPAGYDFPPKSKKIDQASQKYEATYNEQIVPCYFLAKFEEK